MNREREHQFWDCFETLHSDKGIHGYASIYASLPEDIRSITELGIYWGGSLMTWGKMFPLIERITGVDIALERLQDRESLWSPGLIPARVRLQLLELDLRTWRDASTLPDSDLIIDDATHEPDHILAMWDLLHKKAKRFYIIEDIYRSRFGQIWDHVVASEPTAQVSFIRTSSHCGDDRILPDSDSHCLVVRFLQEDADAGGSRIR